MTGRAAPTSDADPDADEHGVTTPSRRSDREFPPALDLVAPAFGVVGLLAASTFTGGSDRGSRRRASSSARRSSAW